MNTEVVSETLKIVFHAATMTPATNSIEDQRVGSNRPMRRLPTNSRRATEELWGELEKRLETARRAYGDAPREVMAHQLELHRDTLDRWNDGDLLNPQFPMSMDVFVVGFENEMGPNLASHLRGIGLRADDSPDNRVAYATMKAYHTRAVVFDARRPSPATFVDMTTERQPHVKCIAVGDPNDREVVERLRTRGGVHSAERC